MKLKNAKVVVCGAGGFIGGHLVKSLLVSGAKVIRAVDVKPMNQWYQTSPAVTNLVLDLKDKDSCMKAAQGAEVVFQLAADMGGMGFIENNKALCMLSVLTNTHMLMAARDRGVERFFYSSSACVYNGEKQKSPDVIALKEEDAYPALPEDGYGWEKLFSERMCRHFEEDFGLQCRVARYHNVYGPLGYLDRRTGKGAGRNLSKNHRSQGVRQTRNRDMGRRQTDPQLHVYRRLHLGHAGNPRE